MKYMFLILAGIATTSCATVIRGAKETAKFESTPSGATVTAESISTDKLGPYTCVTPCEMELKRKRDWNISFELDGYKTAEAVLEKKVTAGGVASGAGNVLAGGLIGIGVDAGTGANLDLRPNPMIAELALADSEKLSIVLADPDADKYKDPDEEINEPEELADAGENTAEPSAEAVLEEADEE